ncbi:MAG: pilus assembly protein PilB [Scytonematopsis contorta HA4267-MV1]|jgi:type II secretory ATPase GspE/PulE/Tfp pilus assembly ATPase PilB-like protein|nr:pilus assembly protein PilB [Scytonematopsis contorta HA4267-MV1]
MLSSEGKPSDTRAINKQGVSTTQTEWHEKLDREQTFWLIESILSFEACLYHQILPFKLKDNKLLLGMVTLEDKAALEYSTRILSAMSCTISTQAMTAEEHRQILSAYLNHKNTSPTPIKNKQSGNGENLEQKKSNINNEFHKKTPDKNIYPEATERGTFIIAQHVSDSYSSTVSSDSGTEGNVLTAVIKGNLTVLQVPPPEKLCSFDELLTLTPKKILEQLLARVLGGGIGRLYLERQPYEGRILWSENGVLQSVLDKVALSGFQGVLNELKRFASLPLVTISDPKQVERECLYKNDRLLLRVRVMPGMYGEEATLQVLRGAALKFYQQQQLTRISRDALGISQQLNFKLRELRQRLVVNSNLNSGQSEALLALNQMLENLDQQISKIITDNPE